MLRRLNGLLPSKCVTTGRHGPEERRRALGGAEGKGTCGVRILAPKMIHLNKRAEATDPRSDPLMHLMAHSQIGGKVELSVDNNRERIPTSNSKACVEVERRGLACNGSSATPAKTRCVIPWVCRCWIVDGGPINRFLIHVPTSRTPRRRRWAASKSRHHHHVIIENCRS